MDFEVEKDDGGLGCCVDGFVLRVTGCSTRRVILVAVVSVGVGVFLCRGGCDRKPDANGFPYQVVMALQNLLIVDGYELRGGVVFTWQEGDSLRVNGIPILPARRSPFGPTKEKDEERVMGFLMRIPFAKVMFDSGKGVWEVSEIYERRLRR